MPRTPLTYIDITPRITIFLIWASCTAVYMWDISKYVVNGDQLIRDWIFIGIFIFISIIWIWSYVIACWSDPGSTEKYYRKLGVLDDINSKRIPPELTLMPICNKCHLPKPERAHHCSKCNLCYFRWDHHCPWIGNCVALNNFKGFLLMPAYGGILLLLFAIELFIFHKNWFCIIPLPFGLYLLYFSSTYFPRMSRNYTSIERFQLNRESPYDIGMFGNIRQFFSGFLGIILPSPPHYSGFYWCGEQVLGMVHELERKMSQKHKNDELSEAQYPKTEINEQEITNENVKKDELCIEQSQSIAHSSDNQTLNDNIDDNEFSSSEGFK